MAQPLNLADRRKTCQYTIAMCANVVAEEASQGAMTNSTFIASQLAPLPSNQSPKLQLKPVRVLDGDCLIIAREMAHDLSNDPTNDTARRVTVLNFASDQLPGGG